METSFLPHPYLISRVACIASPHSTPNFFALKGLMSIDMDEVLDPRRSSSREHEGDVEMLVEMKVASQAQGYVSCLFGVAT